jgi:hypothetical protein
MKEIENKIENKIEIIRQILYAEINANKNLISTEILALSRELDDIIALSYKNELNMKNE